MTVNTQQLRPGDRTPSLTETIQTIVRQILLQVQTSQPGEIVSYDKSTQRASVQPLFDRVFADGQKVSSPVISDVPVRFPAWEGGFIHHPVNPGDPCFLIAAQRSLDNWKSTGGCIDPEFGRIFDLTDLIAIPGVLSNEDSFTPENNTDILLSNGSSQLAISPDGFFAIGNEAEELIQILVDLILSLRNARTVTLTGPQPLLDPADPGFILIEQRLRSLLKE